LAGVDGRLQSRSYEDQTGKRVYVTEVVAESVQFLEPKSVSGNSGGGGGNNNNYYGGGQGGQGGQQNPFSQNQNQNQNQRNQGRSNFDDDPFANDGKPIDISDDDLPF
jgi:single-strand DNA-binding protein